MNARAVYIALVVFLSTGNLHSQPEGYYAPAEGLTGAELKQALHELIDDHAVAGYAELWDHFYHTDRRSDGTIWDMYSDNPDGENPYVYEFGTDQCGNYAGEGDCYNREHSFPKNWFGGEVEPMYTDLFHIYPTDGYVNNRRSNHPYGETEHPSWTSLNGSRVGASSVEGYTGTVFEPVDAYKGDLARTYFYMAVRYYTEDSTWPGSDMTSGAEPLPWALDMLLEWHHNDPVSEKETARNEAVYEIQGNRNPFIDRPEWVEAVWDVSGGTGSASDHSGTVFLYPNPTAGAVSFSLPVRVEKEGVLRIYRLTGVLLHEETLAVRSSRRCDFSFLTPGLYILEIRTPHGTFRGKLVIK